MEAGQLIECALTVREANNATGYLVLACFGIIGLTFALVAYFWSRHEATVARLTQQNAHMRDDLQRLKAIERDYWAKQGVR